MSFLVPGVTFRVTILLPKRQPMVSGWISKIPGSYCGPQDAISGQHFGHRNGIPGELFSQRHVILWLTFLLREVEFSSAF